MECYGTGVGLVTFVNKQLAVTVGIGKLGGAKEGLKTFLVFHKIE